METLPSSGTLTNWMLESRNAYGVQKRKPLVFKRFYSVRQGKFQLSILGGGHDQLLPNPYLSHYSQPYSHPDRRLKLTSITINLLCHLFPLPSVYSGREWRRANWSDFLLWTHMKSARCCMKQSPHVHSSSHLIECVGLTSNVGSLTSHNPIGLHGLLRG
jgi:hypothetical protein